MNIINTDKKRHLCSLKYHQDTFLGISNKLIYPIVPGYKSWFTISEKHPLTKCMFRSKLKYFMELRRHYELKFVIHPYSFFNLYWRKFMALVYFIVVSLDLYKYCVIFPKRKPRIYFKTLSLITNGIWCFDVILLFFTGFEKTVYIGTGETEMLGSKPKHNKIILNLREIGTHYVRTFFVVDVMSYGSVINEILCICWYEYRNKYFIFSVFIRGFRFLSFFKQVKLILPHIYPYKIFCVFFMWFYGSYVFASMYLFSTRFCPICGIPIEEHTTFHPGLKYSTSDTNNTEPSEFSNALTYAFINIIAIKSKSHAINLRYRITYILNILYGLVFRAIFFVVILGFLFQRYHFSLRWHEMLREIKHFLYEKDIDFELQRQFKKYFKNTYNYNYFNEHEITESLTSQMQFQIFVRSSMNLVRNCHLFQDLSHDEMMSLALKLKYETKIPGIPVVKKGEIATCMYFIAAGTVAVYNRHGEEICHLSDGEYFGEIGLVLKHKRTADVISVEFTVLYRLDKNDFAEIVMPNTMLYKRMKVTSINRFNESI